MPGLLARLQKRFADRANERIEHEIEELRAEKVEIAQDRRQSRDVANESVDESVRRNVGGWLDNQLDRFAIIQHPLEGQPLARGLPPIEVFWSAAAGGPEQLRERWRAAVARAEILSDVPLAELDRREAKIDGEIAERRKELDRRRIAGEMAELEREHEQLEERVT